MHVHPREMSQAWSILRAKAFHVATALLLVLCAGCATNPSPDPNRTITLTLVRHGQSVGNASGRVDTSVPGPALTSLGLAQAQMVANRLNINHYDGIYASTMVRTQQTAEPTAEENNETVLVLPGLREIEAGRYEGEAESVAARTYYQDIVRWTEGAPAQRIPGSISGEEFDERFDEAVQSIYDSGDTDPIAFSHGAAIAAWTMMNVANPQLELMTADPLPNTGWVVVTGKPNHWTLVEWNGSPVPN